MTDRYRGRHRGHSLRGPLTVVLALLAIAGIVLPGAYGGYIARVTNNANTAATATYFTCTAAQAGTTPQAYFTYPFGDNGGVSAADVSGSNRTGTYSNVLNLGLVPVGVTYNVPNSGAGAVCPRDNQTTIRLNGSSGYVTSPATAIPAPTTYTVEIWFRTSSAQGKLIGFGNSRYGSSTVFDRQLYIDANGKLVFGVNNPTLRTLTSSASVTDGNWHHAVGTLSSAGMVLYLDGKQVDSNTAVITERANTGYWRIGFDNLAGVPNAPASNYFSGNVAFASVYTSALSAALVAQHYVAGN